MKDTQQSTKRGKSFTADQDVAICHAWLSVIQDPIGGNLQSQNNFWNRVFQNYIDNVNDQNVRSQVSIQSRWGIIMKCCKKFRGCLTQIENRQQSDTTETNKVLYAKLLYYELEGKKFSLDHCWAILENSIKWQDLAPSKKSKTTNSTPNSSFSSQIPETFISLDSNQDPIGYSVDSPRTKRPSGRKAEKEARRKRKIADTSSFRFCDLMEQFNKHASDTKKRKAEIEERKAKVMEQMNQREQEEKQGNEKERDDMIMMMDTSNMDPRTKAYFELRKDEIYAKLLARSTNPDYYTMKRAMPFSEQVDISSDESSSDADDDECGGKESNNNVTIDQPAKDIIPEKDLVIRRAEMYQEYMKQIQIPTHRGSVIPYTSWTGLAKSIKQLYGQPLHYLTNIRLKQWDQLRIGADDEDRPLDTIIHPSKAEASIWLIEEVHRLTPSPHHLAKLWLADPMHHAFIDPIFPKL
ncbi:hypothetical protein F0562_026076 [Nyssa sinensis]|uniref:No apical meristem-associated C-terminal domain-containing protein n=1 Tax=Nyssa sinensis TaxID=561372 RepID=A0A5J5B9R6_9ASTE|nr:hypothetical protein F0562_026076 [Nyssa sinensis]